MMFFLLVILLFLSPTGKSNVIPGIPVRVSPLDSGRLGPVKPTTPKPAQAAALPMCEAACLEHVRGVLDKLFATGPLAQSKAQVCSHYFQAEECMRPLTHCTNSFFPIATSGIRYMCVEQANAFDALLECIGKNSVDIRRDCDLLCNPSSLVAGLAMKDTLMQSLDQPLVNEAINMRDIIEPHIGQIAFSEGCRITECLFQCYQNKFNMLCEGTAGTLIMEMLARPLSSDILKNADIGTQVLTSFFNGMLPHTCKFLMEKQSFRISPELDAEIKRMYADRKQPTVEDFRAFGKPELLKPPNSHSPIMASPLENPSMLSDIPRPQANADPIPIDTDVDDINRSHCIEEDPQRQSTAPKDPPPLPAKAMLVSDDGRSGESSNFVVLLDK